MGVRYLQEESWRARLPSSRSSAKQASELIPSDGSFSIHRPSPDVLAENIKIPGIINAYQDEFFSFDPKATPESELEVKYMSDANHIWRYGYPDEETINAHKKVQILTHPFAWTKKGYDNLENYKTLVNEKYVELIDSIDNECKDFGPLRDNFEKLPVEL